MATANSNPFPVQVNTGTALAQAAAAMAPGSWAPFTCNYDTGTLGNLLFVGRDGGLDKRVTEYSDKMVWDSTRRKIYFTGGGHGVDDTGDQERTIVYDDLLNTWSSLGRPPWYTQQPDGATHGYQHNAFAGNTHFYLQFGRWTVRTRDVTQGNQWSSFAGPSSWGGFATGALEWFPTFGGGSLIVVQGFGGGAGRVGRWNGSTWSDLGTPVIGDYHNVAVYSPIKDIMYFGGGVGSNGRKLYTLSNNGTITARPDSPVRIGTNDSVTTIDPVSGKLLLICADQVVRTFDPDAGWATDTAPPSGFWTGSVYASTQVFGVVAVPIYDYAVTMFITIRGPTIYLRKGR
jgi:hypothetical protein